MPDAKLTAASESMHANDDVARELGIEIISAEPGAAVVSMTVTQAMTNGLDVCHGGIIFTLADTAMAHASNAAGRRTLSTSASIEWLRPVSVGERMVASSSISATRGRNTVHDITVRVVDDPVALVRGQTLTLDES
ncbi:MAG: hotdog fold thioesterase [Ilumatobacter sp.]